MIYYRQKPMYPVTRRTRRDSSLFYNSILTPEEVQSLPPPEWLLRGLWVILGYLHEVPDRHVFVRNQPERFDQFQKGQIWRANAYFVFLANL